MFVPSYFAPTFFPPAYFASGESAAPPSGVVLKYFVADHFAPTYFAPTYFPGGATSIVSGYPDGMFEAIHDLLLASAALSAAGLTCWSDSKPPRTANPSLVVKCPSGTLWTSDDVCNVYTLSPTLTLMASTKAEADALGETVYNAVRGATLAYGAEGEIKTYPFLLRNRRRAKAEGETVGGQLVYRDVTEWQVREIRPL